MNKCICHKCEERFICFTTRNAQMPEDVFKEIHIAVGEASMCWKSIGKGAFNTEAALDVAKRLSGYITERVKEWK